jgi:precorrin-4 methylase
MKAPVQINIVDGFDGGTITAECVIHFIGTVGTLAETARKENITRTALIMVGGFLGTKYDRSKLYDPSFTTGYREATK